MHPESSVFSLFLFILPNTFPLPKNKAQPILRKSLGIVFLNSSLYKWNDSIREAVSLIPYF